MSSDQELSVLQQEDSEDDFDWEEVEVPDQVQEPRHFDITISAPKSAASENKKKGISHAERLLRVDCHKIHTIALIVNAKVRNSWINDPLLQARLLSLAPLHLQIAFGQIHKSRVPDANQRGRMFERAIDNLVTWWANSFFEVLPEGHIKSRTFDEVQQRIERLGLQVKPQVDTGDEVEPYDVETLEDILDEVSERIRTAKSLMKHALDKEGSRDVSAQLFTALCRGLGIPARLVVSIQSVPWQASVGKPKPKYERKPKGKGKGKGKAVEQEPVEDDAGSDKSYWKHQPGGSKLNGEPVVRMSEKAKGKQKAQPKINLRKSKPKGNVLGAPTSSRTRLASPDPLTTPPVFWTEVFSRADSRWFPVDPIRALVNKRKSFDPSATAPTPNASVPAIYQSLPGYIPPPTTQRKAPTTKVENRMVYVVAFEEDGYARDVTRRYAREFGAKVSKVQGGSSAPNIGGGGKGRQAWWDKVVNSISRPYRLNRDDLEDQELAAAEMTEGMPSTIGGFKDHPIYVLTRHLKQTETIHPPPPVTPELGKFRGEPVYPRSAVVSLKTAETWMRNSGRTVRAGEQPMKMVKIRAGTVNRMRELEVLKDELRVAGEGDDGQGTGVGSGAMANAGSEVMQGLYAFSQTEPYVPDPVIDGKVPKNNFGNIDLYVPSMLPEGAAHIPFKGVAKIARKLGFDYAEAVTGFEFKKRRAFPIVEGVVVAAENEVALLEAFWQAEREADEKARIKREDRVFKNWTRLIHGLRIRQRLQAQYSSKPKPKETQQTAAEGDVDDAEEPKEGDQEHHPHDHQQQQEASDSAGGFFAGADRVVQAFHLPVNTHVVLPSGAPTAPHRYVRNRALPRNPGYEVEEQGIGNDSSDESEEDAPIVADFITYDLDEEEIGVDTDAVNTGPSTSRGTSMNMDGGLKVPAPGQLDGASESGATPLQAARPAPKTMQELMDEHAAAVAAEPGSVTVEEDLRMPGSPPSPRDAKVTSTAAGSHAANEPAGDTRSSEKPQNKITLRPRPKAKVSTPNGVADSSSITVSDGVVPRRTQRQTRQTQTQTPIKANSTQAVAARGRGSKAGRGKGRGGVLSPAKKQRGKKRRRADEDDEDSEPEPEVSSSESDADMEEVDISAAEEPSVLVSVDVLSADEEDIATPPPNKRARRTRGAAAKPSPTTAIAIVPTTPVAVQNGSVTTPTSTRTLRPRASKSAAKLAEERKMEEAYRKAVAR